MEHEERGTSTHEVLGQAEAPVITTAVRGTAVHSSVHHPALAAVDVDAVVMTAYQAYAERLKGFAYAAVHDDAAADDLVGETFLRLIIQVRAGVVPTNIPGWLFRVCGNLVVSGGRHRSVAQRLWHRLVDRRVQASAEEEALGRTDHHRLRTALGELPADARVALLMAAQGADSSEIAREIGRSPGATRTYVCRARVRLRELMAVTEDVRT